MPTRSQIESRIFCGTEPHGDDSFRLSKALPDERKQVHGPASEAAIANLADIPEERVRGKFLKFDRFAAFWPIRFLLQECERERLSRR
jgi:hypothetical protein